MAPSPKGRLARVASCCAVLLGLLWSGAAVAAEPPAGFTELPEGTYARRMVAGPDGALWFTTFSFRGIPSIGRVDAGGALREFALPERPRIRDDFGVGALVAGPDGNLWFTRPRIHSVGYVTPTGAFTEINRSRVCPPPRPNGRECLQPTKLVAGGDGALWLAEPDTRTIVRVTPAGGLTEFPLARGRAPRDMTWGVDGALWFTQWRSDRIGRLTSAGELTEFRVGRPRWTIEEIAAGSDGAIWFMVSRERKASLFGRIAAGGEVTWYPTPGGSGDLIAGPDGSIWTTGGLRSISPDGLMTGGIGCVSDCDRPIDAFGFDGYGELWVGLGAESCTFCGGGTLQALDAGSHGFVGRFKATPAAARIAPGAAPVGPEGGTAMTLTCAESVPCAGNLRLTRFVAPPKPKRRKGHGKRRLRGRDVLVAETAYSLEAGSTARLPLTLTAEARALLGQEGVLRLVWATATAPDRAATFRTVTLEGA